jgi:hypothetical protein
MPNDERNLNDEIRNQLFDLFGKGGDFCATTDQRSDLVPASSFGFRASFVICHSSFVIP